MPKKRTRATVAVTGEQRHRTPRLTAHPDASVIRLLVPLMDRLEDAFPVPNYPESQLPTPTRQPKIRKNRTQTVQASNPQQSSSLRTIPPHDTLAVSQYRFRKPLN